MAGINTRQQRLAASFAHGVATGDNRTNSSGANIGNLISRTSQTIANVVPAGGSLTLPVNGSTFYLQVATGQLQIRPAGGVFAPYSQGTGLNLLAENAFDRIDVTNNNAYSVVFQLFIGFDGFIDNRLILDTSLTQTVVYPTYPKPSVAAAVAITDKSGSAFTDINGNQWLAIQRQAIVICNTDSGVTLLLQESETTTSNDDAIAAIYPVTSLTLPISGNYALNIGGGNVNAIVSELYLAIPKTI